MTLYPETQKKAQEEIDRVVGKGRLPTMDDFESLPYVTAVMRESLRWHPISPLGKITILRLPVQGIDSFHQAPHIVSCKMMYTKVTSFQRHQLSSAISGRNLHISTKSIHNRGVHTGQSFTTKTCSPNPPRSSQNATSIRTEAGTPIS